MNYEKKYKEALEKARNLHGAAVNGGYVTDVKNFETIFPELTESEDEKSIKNLIDELKCSLRAANCQNEACNGGHEKRIALLEWAITWLEKQGEQKEYTFKSIPRLLDMIEPTERAKAYTKKLINTLTKEGYITDAKIVEECLKQMNGEDVALAVMDEKQSGNLVENGYTNNKDIIKYANNYSHEIWYKLMDSFKNIKDYHIGCNDVSDIVLNAIIDAYNWIEKQGKQNKWKPSKEEMDVLYGLAYITNQYDEHKEEVITRLYQDLKREFFNGSSYENMFPNTEDDVRRRSTIQILEYARSLDNYNQYGKEDIDKNIAWLEKQSSERKQLYVRFGDIPSNEKSKIYRGEEEIGYENGVSVYPAFVLNGNIVLGLTLPITKTTLYTQQHLLEYDNRPCYLVSGDYVGKGTDGEPLIRNISIIKRLYNYRIKELEKQGEQKTPMEKFLSEIKTISESLAFTNQEECDEYNQMVSDLIMSDNDKVIPKFKVGDWIINSIETVQITGYDIDYGYQVNYKGNFQHRDTDIIEKEYHLWTIQDAKDGDILSWDATMLSNLL